MISCTSCLGLPTKYSGISDKYPMVIGVLFIFWKELYIIDVLNRKKHKFQ